MKFNIPGLTPAKGRLLLSAPHLSDINFTRSVIILVEHNIHGSIGFVLNEKTQYTIQDITEGFPKNFNFSVYKGGPCDEQNIHCIHNAGNLIAESSEFAPGIFWGGNFHNLISGETSWNNDNDKYWFKFFLGYSGWGAQQLEEEIRLGSWLVTSCKTEFFRPRNPKENLWKEILLSLGDQYAIMANAPLDPSWN